MIFKTDLFDYNRSTLGQNNGNEGRDISNPPELELYHWMQFSVILRTSEFALTYKYGMI